MKSKSKGNSKYMSSVKVGPKGQIVIPKEVRDMFGISSGDTLILLADSSKGIALERIGVFSKIADAIFNGKAKEIYPEQNDEDSLTFAKEIKRLENSDADEEDEE
jgi:AbrB family looped-hinge helix DNA binding protein